MAFFKHFPRRWEEFNGSKILLPNITKHVYLRDEFIRNESITIPHRISDGQTPDILSHRIYSTDEYWWVILMANGITNYHEEWPMLDDELEDHIERKYPGSDPYDKLFYRSANGVIVTSPAEYLGTFMADDYGLTTEAAVKAHFGFVGVSIMEYETSLNDAKRNIRIIDPMYIGKFESEVERVFNE